MTGNKVRDNGKCFEALRQSKDQLGLQIFSWDTFNLGCLYFNNNYWLSHWVGFRECLVCCLGTHDTKLQSLKICSLQKNVFCLYHFDKWISWKYRVGIKQTVTYPAASALSAMQTYTNINTSPRRKEVHEISAIEHVRFSFFLRILEKKAYSKLQITYYAFHFHASYKILVLFLFLHIFTYYITRYVLYNKSSIYMTFLKIFSDP